MSHSYFYVRVVSSPHIVTTFGVNAMGNLIEDKLWEDYEYCYECSGYGNDYSFDDDGELVCNCDDCLFNQERSDDDETD